MNSYDVFDTLIARRYVDSTSYFVQIEREFGLINFAEIRLSADNGRRLFPEIYQVIQRHYQIDDALVASVAAYELQLELDNIVPIRKNLQQVKDGELLISDTYLTKDQILQLLYQAGLEKQVALYQSNGDKASSKVWQEFRSGLIRQHLGDNWMSDVQNPRQHGISAELTTLSSFAPQESFVDRFGLHYLALLMREVRLRQGFTAQRRENEEIYRLSLSLNLPLLLFASELLRRQHPAKTYVFLGRDCYLWQKLYSCFYDQDSTYLPFSRKVAYNQKELSLQYLKSNSDAYSLLIDVCSTGATWQWLNLDANQLDVLVLVGIDTDFYTKAKPIPGNRFSSLFQTSAIGQVGLMIELMNCANHGHLSALQQPLPGLFVGEYSQPELSEDQIHAVHTPILEACSLSGIYRTPLLAEMSQIDSSLLRLMATKLIRLMEQNKAEQAFKRLLSHSNDYIQQLKPS